MDLPRWLPRPRKLPSRAEMDDSMATARDLAGRLDAEAAIARRLRHQNQLGAIIETALGLRNRDGEET